MLAGESAANNLYRGSFKFVLTVWVYGREIGEFYNVKREVGNSQSNTNIT